MFAPTPGKFLVAVNAGRRGVEKMALQTGGTSRFSRLIYWLWQRRGGERVMSAPASTFYALNPQTASQFAVSDRMVKRSCPARRRRFRRCHAAPAIFERFIVVPGFKKDFWGFDVITGRTSLDVSHRPQPGEFGHDTWMAPSLMARIAGPAWPWTKCAASLTSPPARPAQLHRRGHRGDNLFANCLIALDARTGKSSGISGNSARHWTSTCPAPPISRPSPATAKKWTCRARDENRQHSFAGSRQRQTVFFPSACACAPTSQVRGEQTAPYQPDPELPERFSKMEFTAQRPE